MKSRTAFAAALAAALIALPTAFGAVQSTGDFKANEVIVKYKDGIHRTKDAMTDLYTTANAVKVKRFHGQMRQFEQLILQDGTDVRDTVRALENDPNVEYAQPNYILRALPVQTEVATRGGGLPPGLPCVAPNFPPGCTPNGGGGGGGGGLPPGLPCLMPNFPPGCTPQNGPAPSPTPDPTPQPDPSPQPQPPSDQRPAVGERPGEINPPVADPDLGQAYGIAKIGAPDAWKITRGSHDMVVAVIDTGVDYNHEDLAFNMWRNPNPDPKIHDLVGYDFIHNDGLPFDDHSHGTHCSGVIGAVGGNGKGISGVNQRVSIMALKFLSAEGSGDTAGAIKAIDYAVAHGAKVLSNSWGGSGDDDNKGLRDAIKRAADKDVLFVAAAGNDNGANDDTTMTYPASFSTENMLVVAATDSTDDLAFFSNIGPKTVHLGAPGVDVYSSIPGNKYEKMSGTSMACPHVAGAAALLWSAHPKWTHTEVKARLMESVDKVPALDGKTVTGGRLNIAKALANP